MRPPWLIYSVGVLVWAGILAVSNIPAPPDHLRVLVLAAAGFSISWRRIDRANPPSTGLALAVGPGVDPGGWRVVVA